MSDSTVSAQSGLGPVIVSAVSIVCCCLSKLSSILTRSSRAATYALFAGLLASCSVVYEQSSWYAVHVAAPCTESAFNSQFCGEGAPAVARH